MARKVRAVAESGIRIACTEPLSRHLPHLNQHRGIGLKNAGTETWEALYDVKLFSLEWTIQAPGSGGGSVFLPRMGMPPREPEEEMMKLARAGESFDQTGWIIYASVMKAVDALPQEWIKVTPSPHGYPRGDDVVISLPDVAVGLEHSMKELDAAGNPKIHLDTSKEMQKKFEFRTALPVAGTGIGGEVYDLEHLYFIQLLPNELPSYYFWARPEDTPTDRKGEHDPRIDIWFSLNAKTSNPDSNKKQGLRDTTPPRHANGSSLINVNPNINAPRLSPGGQRAAKNASATKSQGDTKFSKKRVTSKKNKVDKSYKPEKDEVEEMQEVKLNKRKKKIPEDAKLYRPGLDDEKPQQVKINKRKPRGSENSKSYKPGRVSIKATRK